MNNYETNILADLRLAPYMQKATALIGKKRMVGGNQFRHQIATLGILIDYHYTNSVLLKASVIHDLFEDIKGYNPDEIRAIDNEGPDVVNLVFEVTKGDESKVVFLRRILEHGSFFAKVLKTADRISNLTDLNTDIFNKDYIEQYLNDTEQIVYPIALEVNEFMAVEVFDLIQRRRKLLE